MTLSEPSQKTADRERTDAKIDAILAKMADWPRDLKSDEATSVEPVTTAVRGQIDRWPPTATVRRKLARRDIGLDRPASQISRQ